LHRRVASPSARGADGVFIRTSHELRVYDEATGAQLASWTTGGVISSSPAIANGRIYFGSTDHTFYVLKAGPR